MVDNNVLAKPYIVLFLMAIFFLLAINLPKLFHPSSSSVIAPIMFPRIHVSAECNDHMLSINITNDANETALIDYIAFRNTRIYVNKTIPPNRTITIHTFMKDIDSSGIAYARVVLNGHKYNILFMYTCSPNLYVNNTTNPTDALIRARMRS